MSAVQVHKKFYSGAKKLRQEFDTQFSNPRTTGAQRFVWDYWYFEDQYHLLRTPAVYYFSKKIYQEFHSQLVQWGRENLGCHDISPPWLSYYVDGCYQNLHSDVPHGPWAYVYSLTLDPKAFRGGETLILKDDVLDYWTHFQNQQNHEYNNFVHRIPAHFNQLVVFDPRYPHGVTEVKGTRDPQKARLVIHGWFVNPRPYVVGGLKTSQVQKPLAEAMAQIAKVASELGFTNGTVSLKLEISIDGKVNKFKELTNTLKSLAHQPSDVVLLNKALKLVFKDLQFPRAQQKSHLVIPILFQ